MAQAPARRVRIEEITYPPNRRERLLDRRIEQPRVPPDPEAPDLYGFTISGWAIGNRSPLAAVELVHRGVLLDRAAVQQRPDLAAAYPDAAHAARSGIRVGVSAVDLPYRFRVVVRAVLEDETRAPIAAFAGVRAPLPPVPGEGPAPVLLTMIGRTGSTALSNLLCHHPDIAGFRTWDTETRVASYWADVLRGLARPHSYERQLDAGGGMSGDWWLGRNTAYPGAPKDLRALRAVGEAGVEALASFCSAQIARVTASLAGAAGKPGARYFVEKAAASRTRSTAQIVEEIDPRARELVLVRDPRDMACSMLAYSRKKGFRGFGPSADASMEEMIRWLSFNGTAGLLDYLEQRGRRAHVVRYEDLVMRPRETLSAVLAHIGADARPEIVDAMIERLEGEAERRADHATTDSVGSSVGRWRDELSESQQGLAEELFGPFLGALGYD